MDTPNLLTLMSATAAFAARGDDLPEPLGAAARSHGQQAFDALLHHLRTARLDGQGITFTADGVMDLVMMYDSFVGGSPPGVLAAPAVLALWAFRQEAAARLCKHPGGAMSLRAVNRLPAAQAAQAKAAQAERGGVPPAAPAPADARMPQRMEPVFTPPPPDATPGQRERAAVPEAPSARIEGDSIMFGDPPPQREAATAPDAAPEDAPDPRLPVAKEPAAAG